MAILLFILYLFFFSYIIYRCFQNKEKPLFFVAAFWVKVLSGVLYGFLHFKMGHSDTATFFEDSLQDLAMLKSHPGSFVTSLLHDDYGYSSLLDSQNSFFKHFETHLFTRLLALFNIITGSSYYVNVVLFNLLVFWAHYYLFLFFCKIFPARKNILASLVFFFPPLLFWVSGLHKDGLVFLGMAGAFYFFYQFVLQKKIAQLVKSICFLCLVFLFKNYLALVFIPVMALWYLIEVFPGYKKAVFFAGIVAGIAGFFLTGLLKPGLNLPLQFANRQNDFLMLKGNSLLSAEKLEPTLSGYLSRLHAALNHAFIRPFFTDGKSVLNIVSSIEILAVNFFVLWAIFFGKINWSQLKRTPAAILLLFVLVNYLVIGYIIPFAGAIVRYRALFEPILLCLAAGVLKKDILENSKFGFKN